MRDKISLEIKEFIIDSFSSESDFDNLCIELDVKNIFSGNFDTRITGLIKTIERDLPDYIHYLYNALIKLKVKHKDEIDGLFNTGIDKKQETLAVLFSDIKNYSKIKNDELKQKITLMNLKFKDDFNDQDQCIYINTWGDAFYILYKNPSSLLKKAVTLRDHFMNYDWKTEGFDQDLQIRIGLHLIEGTIFYKNGKAIDSVGIGIDESARIEPVVAPNNIFVSSAFHEVVLSHTDLEFDYLGVQRLAKDYGELDLYLVEGGEDFDKETFFHQTNS